MIGYIKGKIIEILPSKAIIDTGGVGYLISSTPDNLSKMRVGMEVSFWVYTAVRENSIDLYGFNLRGDLDMFEMLLSVSGVGPKSALTILSVAGVLAIEEAVSSGDSLSLIKISGIGKKTAEKIVIELGGKINTIRKSSKTSEEDIDVFEALQSLGYRDRDIQETMKNIPKDAKGANEKIKIALRFLGRN